MHGTEFQLRLPGNGDFASRQKLLFDTLNTAEEECNKTRTQNVTTTINEPEDDEDINRSKLLKLGRRTITSRFRGRESIFKRPEGPAPKAASRAIPDFHRNPHRWTKYSLEDVPREDLTEESNTRAALSFLNELKARRKSEKLNNSAGDAEMKEVFDSSKKILFKSKGKSLSKGKNLKTNLNKLKEEGGGGGGDGNNSLNSDGNCLKFNSKRNLEKEEEGKIVEEGEEEGAVFRGSRVVMPEYIVGSKKKKKRNDRNSGNNGKGVVKTVGRVDGLRQLKLSHLEEEEIDE